MKSGQNNPGNRRTLNLKTSPKARIGVDLMGSDTSPEELSQAVVQLQDASFPADLVVFSSPYPDTITMSDPPTSIRHKKNSSLWKGLSALKDGSIDAFISLGNTGALLLAAKTLLKTSPGIHRPALMTLLPTQKSPLAVLDVGANLSLSPRHFLELAHMGIAYQKSRGIPHPTVALLNIGKEPTKGPPHLSKAHTLLSSLPTFLGNIEGKDVFQGHVDVLVTDGFAGNIFLKTAEGVAAFLRSPHPSAHPGAILAGVNGLVIKCHGDATPATLASAIKHASHLLNNKERGKEE